ncbi:hypothetical protein [Microbacterium algeriense]|uniref:PH domain-containing protein n=1 Tax=Microbacterium algeriense TaxID=2615184 RepID=A0ABQ6V4P0_9MICO|nr:hypothetical protein [Microbacterium algeriense]KAB1864031.1 hypothetical protein F6A08_07745 [Microbacterium algeriense]
MHHSAICGSARGVRVAGAVWALFSMGGGVLLLLEYDLWPAALAFAAVGGFLLIRPWFMGVWLEGDSIRVGGWFHSFRLSRSEVTGIELEKCMGLLVGFQTGFLPFVGRVRMIQVEIVRKGRVRYVSLAGAIGRYNTVLKVVREMRVHVGLPK